jgi:uncharacterized protein (DUF362 family)
VGGLDDFATRRPNSEPQIPYCSLVRFGPLGSNWRDEMALPELNRREFLLAGAGALAAARFADAKTAPKPVVAIARVKNDRIEAAVEEAIDLLGGIGRVTKGKGRILLKPNLVFARREATTKPEVIRALARLMRKAGKDVSIGEGSAAAADFNVRGREIFRTRRRDILDPMQQHVFDELRYTELAKELRVPLVNLHSGDLVDVKVPGAFVFDTLTIHRALTETDLLCSVPMMKTHQLATVTLGMKNLVGVLPGTIYQSVRGHMHDEAARVEPTGVSAVVVDMVRANKLGLVVVDGSTAMEGDGPSDGPLVKMDVIVAGTSPVATDMVASAVMGFEPREVPVFEWAGKAGLKPASLDEIEVRGAAVEAVRRSFARPHLRAWNAIRPFWGAREL